MAAPSLQHLKAPLENRCLVPELFEDQKNTILWLYQIQFLTLIQTHKGFVRGTQEKKSIFCRNMAQRILFLLSVIPPAAKSQWVKSGFLYWGQEVLLGGSVKQLLPSFHIRTADGRRCGSISAGSKGCSFPEARRPGSSEIHQGLKFKLSKYLIVHASVWPFTHTQ